MIKVKVIVGIMYRGPMAWDKPYFEPDYNYEEEYATIAEAKKVIKSEYRIYDYKYSKENQEATFWVY